MYQLGVFFSSDCLQVKSPFLNFIGGSVVVDSLLIVAHSLFLGGCVWSLLAHLSRIPMAPSTSKTFSPQKNFIMKAP